MTDPHKVDEKQRDAEAAAPALQDTGPAVETLTAEGPTPEEFWADPLAAFERMGGEEDMPPAELTPDEPEKGEAAGTAEDGPAGPEGEEGKGKLPSWAQEVLDKRIAKEVAKRKEMETELEQLRAQAQEAANGLPVGDNPYLGKADADLDKEDRRLREFEKWCLENWDGYEADPDRKGDRDYSPREVRQAYARVKEDREVLLPRARQAGQVRKESERIAKETFGFYSDPEHPGHARLQTILRDPSTKALERISPHTPYLAGLLVEGMMAVEARQKKLAATPEKPKAQARRSAPPPPVPMPNGAGSRSPYDAPGAGPELPDISALAEQGGDRDTLAGLIRSAMG